MDVLHIFFVLQVLLLILLLCNQQHYFKSQSKALFWEATLFEWSTPKYLNLFLTKTQHSFFLVTSVRLFVMQKNNNYGFIHRVSSLCSNFVAAFVYHTSVKKLDLPTWLFIYLFCVVTHYILGRLEMYSPYAITA